MIKTGPLLRILRQNLRRNLRHIVLSSIGIVIGIAAFVFFWGLSAGVSKVVLHDIFPINRVEVVAPKTSLTGIGAPIDDKLVALIASRPEVSRAIPKMKMLFPASGIGELQGSSFRFEVGGFCDGIDPVLVAGDPGLENFKDWDALEAGKMDACKVPPPPASAPTEDSSQPAAPSPPAPPPANFQQCKDYYYCGNDNLCHHRIPVLVSRILIEMYNGSFAPAHNMPRIGSAQEAALKGMLKSLHFGMSLNDSVFQGPFAKNHVAPEHVEAMPIGISDKAMAVGMTIPIGYLRRWNGRFVNADAAKQYSSVVVDLKDSHDMATFVPWVRSVGYENEESQAGRIALIIVVVTALFLVIAFTIMFISAVNISHTFFMVVSERRREIGLLRALGASRLDIWKVILGEAAVIGVLGGVVGVGVALGLARTIDWLSASKLPDFEFKPTTYFVFSPGLLAAALGFAVLFCIVGASLPARQAAAIEPARALSG